MGRSKSSKKDQNRPLFSLDVYATAIMLERRDVNGSGVARYPISPFDAASLFSTMPLGIMGIPQNIWCWSLLGGQEFVAMWEPAKIRTLDILGESFEIPMPATLFCGHGVRYWVLALKDNDYPSADGNEKLYFPPLGNIFNDGSVCTGDVVFPQCSIATINEASQLFWSSEFNEHLAGYRVMTDGQPSPSSPYDTIKTWAEAGVHDENALVPTNLYARDIQRLLDA